jgi:hypothetical protein
VSVSISWYILLTILITERSARASAGCTTRAKDSRLGPSGVVRLASERAHAQHSPRHLHCYRTHAAHRRPAAGLQGNELKDTCAAARQQPLPYGRVVQGDDAAARAGDLLDASPALRRSIAAFAAAATPSRLPPTIRPVSKWVSPGLRNTHHRQVFPPLRGYCRILMLNPFGPMWPIWRADQLGQVVLCLATGLFFRRAA